MLCILYIAYTIGNTQSADVIISHAVICSNAHNTKTLFFM